MSALLLLAYLFCSRISVVGGKKMYCKNCGKEIEDKVKFCPNCGTATSSVPQVTSDCSEKSRTIAALLAFFLGGLGIHRFYLGKSGTGVLQILLSFCFGIGCVWALIDLIVILCGNFKDKDGKLVTSWEVRY